MSTHLFKLYLDASDEEQWHLKAPVDASGQRFDWQLLAPGEPLAIAGQLLISVSQPGRPLDITLRGYEFVVTERIGSLIAELAPNDVQRIPARVESRDGRYEVLNVLSRLDCVDRERTVAQVTVEGDPPYVEEGTLASLAPLLEDEPDINLYRYVGPRDMRLKTDGLEGGRIFRVEGWDLWPVVTEDIKLALEEEGATGVEYRLVS